MNVKRWICLIGSLLATALVATSLGGRPAEMPDSDFTPIALSSAPAELQQHYETAKGIPGLFVLRKEGQTYLLLLAGGATEPGMGVEVIEVRGTGSLWRVLATLEPGGANLEYPHALVQVRAPRDADFAARLSGPDGEVRELVGMVISDR